MPTQDTRAALIKAATKLFSDRGYEAVSTREIADAASVNLGAIQYHFGNKSQLFIETVRCLMHTTGAGFRELQLLGEPTSKLDAGIRLGHFVRSFLTHASETSEPQGCRMMCREVLSGRPDGDLMLPQLIDAVVADFMKPFQECMVATIRVLAPALSEQQLRLAVTSIAGQCTIYITHAPFLEVLDSSRFEVENEFDRIAEHITGFSLRGLGCSEDFIETVRASLREKGEN